MYRKNSCCRDCKSRYVGCHDECTQYLDEVEELGRLKATISAYKHRNYDIISYKSDGKTKLLKKHK